MGSLELSQLNLSPWVVISLGTLCTVVVLLVSKRIILGRIKKLTSRSQYHLDSILVEAVQPPLTLLIITATLLVLRHLMGLHDIGGPTLNTTTNTIAMVVLICATILFADRLASRVLNQYSSRSDALKNSRGILTGVSRGIILCIGVLVILGTLGISITPIIASLGITSLAVALALQPTLENFFSGVQLVVDKPFRVGDYIELDSGEQGFVERVGWRSTWIKMLPNNTVIVPNSVLSQSKLVNYFYPEKELSVPVEVGVHYHSDLDHVETVTLEVAREILKSHKWGVASYETFVVFHTFDSSSINFTVMLRAQEYFNRFFLKSEFIKALHRRYAEEGIVIPYPIRAINYDQEKPVSDR